MGVRPWWTYSIFLKRISKNTAASTADTASSSSALHDKLNEENSISDYWTWYLRVLTAALMKYNPDRYLPFLLAKGTGTSTSVMDIPTFFAWEVTECFGVNVTIEYMDGRIVQEKDGM